MDFLLLDEKTAKKLNFNSLFFAKKTLELDETETGFKLYSTKFSYRKFNSGYVSWGVFRALTKI